MDTLNAVIAVRGTVAILLIAGGAFCILQGSRLIKHHLHGASSPTHFKFKVGGQELGFSTGVAGTAVSLTSAAWILCAVMVVPSVENPEGWTVSSVPDYEGTAQADPAMASLPPRVPRSRSLTELTFFEGQTSLTDQQKAELLTALLRLEQYDEHTIEVVLKAKGIEADSAKIARQLNEDRLKAVLEFLKSGAGQEGPDHEVTVEEVALDRFRDGDSVKDHSDERGAFATLKVSEVKDGKSGA